MRMKLFQTVLKVFTFLGVNINRIHDGRSSLNKNIFVSFFLCGSCIILTGTFLVLEANCFMEYTAAIYIFSTAVVITISTAFVVYKTDSFLEYSEKIENVINSSE